MSIAKPEPWTESAACHQYNPENWYAKENTAAYIGALRVCAGCDVQSKCLEYAMQMGEDFGIWGGLTEVQRRQMQKKRAA